MESVCDWYLGVYIDAYEWVELPNTLGMALFADGGIMASKPYAASGKYIQKQGDHCKSCRYDPKKVTGEGACPYNGLYWHFIDRHNELLSQNPRMGLILGGWRKRLILTVSQCAVGRSNAGSTRGAVARSGAAAIAHIGGRYFPHW